MTSDHRDEPLGPVDPLRVPRFAGPSTSARFPRLDEVTNIDVAIVAIPFEDGKSLAPRPTRTVRRSVTPPLVSSGLDVLTFEVQSWGHE